MKIYVTGSSGLAGHNLVDAFRAHGHEVVTSRSRDVNLLDYGVTADFLAQTAPDVVVHAAGKVGGIQANVKDPYGFFLENMEMGMNVVKAVIATGVPRMINLSSSCSYPCALGRPLTENDVFDGKLEPTNEGYAIAKAAITRLCAFAAHQHPRCSIKTLIACNLYGKYDKFGESNSHMIPAVIRKLHEAKLAGTDRVTIWGDGLARREFLCASDFGEMVAACLDRFGELPEAMNLGLGYDHTVNEYYETIARVVGYAGTFEHDLTKPVGMKRKLLDISLQKRFGVTARMTLEEGVAETYRYFLDFVEGKG